jgi:NAD+ diphosphatase
VGLADGETSTEGLSSLRELGGTLDEFELGISMHAIALSNWHRSHPHCARCGAETTSTLGGSVRVCVKDQSQHHPRTDSAVIVLVKDKDDRILLGHQPIWPDGRFSTFAGFLEPGETFEQCVEREVFEESGVKVNEIKYLGSQPWPFPASIMIAFSAVVDNPSTAKADGVEITEVRWFTRDELKSSVADGSLLLPPTISVARKMIAMWFGPGAEKLTGGESWR